MQWRNIVSDSLCVHMFTVAGDDAEVESVSNRTLWNTCYVNANGMQEAGVFLSSEQ
jgi:hypothetical protein